MGHALLANWLETLKYFAYWVYSFEYMYLNILDCKALNENDFWFAHEKLIITQGNLYELKVGLPDQ